MSKVIAVFGATGAQGGSVVNALLNHGFHVNALTRNANSERAKSLSNLQNVTVTETNLDDPASLDRALKGCYGAFLVTDFASHFEHKEITQGKNAIDSAIRNGVSHVVFSGLDNVEKVIGKPCYHFDYKAKIEEYGLENADKINFTSVRLSSYFENLENVMLTKVGDKSYDIIMPMGDKPLYGQSVDDLGECVASVFKNPNEYKSKILGLATYFRPSSEYVEILNKHLSPLHFTYRDISYKDYESLGFPGVVDLSRMFEYYQSGTMERDIALTKALNKNALDFEQWVIKKKDSFLKKLSN